MSSISIAHKYRPRTFGDIVGQETAKKMVRGMFQRGQVPRAFLIEGPRGNGKTTFGRLISMRLNCTKPTGVDPCGKCRSCKSYLTNPPEHPCHVEINASDRRKIDDIRELIVSSRYHAAGGQYKVYMLDEVHALIPQAQDALLKPLEDPAPEMVWILCTTDPGKLKDAIQSRCEAGHLVIRPASTKALAKRIGTIAKQEGYDLDRKTLTRIADSGVHVRDAIGILEKLINAIEDAKNNKRKKVTLSKLLPRVIESVQSGRPDAMAFRCACGIIGNNLTSSIECTRTGLPPDVFLQALSRIWNEVILYSSNPKLISNYFGFLLRQGRKDDKDFKFELGRDDLLVLVRAGEFLTKQYERAKSYLIDDAFLLTMTVATMHQICSEIHPKDE